MKIKIRSIVVAILIVIFFIVLPLASPMFVPPELFRTFSIMGGIDLVELLNKVAVIGLALSILVLLMGSVKKTSKAGLALSIISKIVWIIIVFFILGLGKIENLGLAVLGGSNGAVNIVVFDLRLIAILTTLIISLKIVSSIFEFREIQSSS